MADQRRRSRSRGRVTPKAGTPPKKAAPGDPDTPVQVGRRPSSPGFLVLVGVMWLAVGVVIMLALTWSWRFAPGIVAIGIGLMFLRGAGATVLRREGRSTSGR